MNDKVFCSNCGKQISRTTKFCPFCGAANREFVSADGDGAQPSSQTMVNQHPVVKQVSKAKKPWQHRKLTRGNLIALVVGLFVIVVAGIFGAKQYYGNRYDIYAMPVSKDYDSGPEENTLKFLPKTFIQINDHFMSVTTIGTSSDNPNQIYLASSRIPIVKSGSQLKLNYNQGQYLVKIYWPDQFWKIVKVNPKNNIDQLNLQQSLGTSSRSVGGVTFTGHVETMLRSTNAKNRKSFNNREQIVHYFYGSGSNLRKLKNHKSIFDFNAATSSKNVKKVKNGDKYNQEIDRMDNWHYAD